MPRRRLSEIAASMRSKLPEQTADVRKLCIVCKERLAKVNDIYCSRCSGTKMQEGLRDALPGAELPQRKVIDGKTYNVGFDPAEDDTHYTRLQVAEMLGCSSSALTVWEKAGKTPQPIRRSNKLYYTPAMIEQIKQYILTGSASEQPRKIEIVLPPGLPKEEEQKVREEVTEIQERVKKQGTFTGNVSVAGKKAEKSVARHLSNPNIRRII